MHRRTTGLIVTAVVLAGCAGNPKPIIDTKGVDPDLLAQDMAECEVFTEEVDLAGGVGKGAALGGTVGAATGAVSNRRDVDEAAASVRSTARRGPGSTQTAKNSVCGKTACAAGATGS